MKKILSILLALSLLLSAAAFAEATDLTGEWYGSIFGAPVTLTLSEDGTYEIVSPLSDEPSTGVWELTDDGVVIDAGTEQEYTMAYDGESLTMTQQEDDQTIEVVFTREMPETFEPAAVKADAALEDFAGNWVASYVNFMDMTLDVAAMGMDMTLSVDDTTATLNSESMQMENESMDLPFADGALGLEVSGDDESADGVAIRIQMLEDGMLALSLDFFGTQMVFYMTAVE